MQIAEKEDLDPISLALTAAEMGHLEIAALPTGNAVTSIERMVECFPDYRQQQIRSQLSDVLTGVISQQLLPRQDGGGRVAAFEVLLANQEIQSLIKEQKYFQVDVLTRFPSKRNIKSLDRRPEQ